MVSVVVPVFNEEESLSDFYKELISSLVRYKDYEVIFVDDGSKDKSLNILRGFEEKNKNIRIFSFRKNQGKAEALTLGFQKAKGDNIVTLDADLQDKPSEIQKLLEELKRGFDLVCGWKKDRKDPIHKVLASKLFNFLASIFWGLKLHDYNCGLKAYSKDAAKSLRFYGGLYRFIPLLVFQQGFRVTEVPVTHSKRRFGKSKYGFSKLWKDLPDIFTMLFLSRYASRPLHFFGRVGGVMFILGILALAYLYAVHATGQAITSRPLFFFGIILVLGGLQVFFTGFLADLFINSASREKDIPLKYSSED